LFGRHPEDILLDATSGDDDDTAARAAVIKNRR
jgi:hypothetical protein